MAKGKRLDDESSATTLIKAYGEFWNPDLVNWERTWQLNGSDSVGKIINVYEQRGVYVLYQDYVPVYVGMADRQSIGYRLQLHRESRRKGPRWDRFSWFGLKAINKNGTLRELNSHSHARTSELIATIEALLIRVINPPLNARREKFKNAIQLHQSDQDKPISETDRRLIDIEKKIDSLLNQKNN
jgi:hypothetical protein